MNKNELNQVLERVTHHLTTLRDPENKYAVLVPDGRLIPNRDFTFWEWTSGVGLYGIMRYYKISNDKRFLDIIIEWFDNQDLKNVEKNINTMVQMLTVCDLYEITNQQKYLDWIEEWAKWLVNDLPRTEENGFQHVVYASIHDGQIWTDTLMMSALTIGRIGKLLNKQTYKEEAKYQFLLHSKWLFDKFKGLWFHGYSFNERSNFSGVYWGRGNSWPSIAIPEIIAVLELPKEDAFRNYLEVILKTQIKTLVKFQDQKTGLWRTIIDDDTSYFETSCTAGFAFGMQIAIQNNLIDQKYQSNVDLAIKGLLANIDEHGALQNVSGGTPVFKTKEEYKKVIVGDYPYGQSMAILALGEYLKNLK